MVKDAEAHPGKPYRKPLYRGLRVDVMLLNGETHLQISRDNVWPSPKEWDIVTRDWPAPVPNLTPRRIFDQGRYYLKAKWTQVHQTALVDAV
jgi:hypothetical protein